MKAFKSRPVRAGRPARRAEILGPTPEQLGRGAFELSEVTDKRAGGGTITIGKAYRRTPVFETLARQGLFSISELKALRHYRHHADLADRSPLRDSIDRMGRVTTPGDGPTAMLITAMRIRDDLERAAGSLRDILRAVVVDDVTLSEWAIHRAGGVEERRGKGSVIKPRRKALEVARLEIQVVAKRLAAELEA